MSTWIKISLSFTDGPAGRVAGMKAAGAEPAPFAGVLPDNVFHENQLCGDHAQHIGDVLAGPRELASAKRADEPVRNLGPVLDRPDALRAEGAPQLLDELGKLL